MKKIKLTKFTLIFILLITSFTAIATENEQPQLRLFNRTALKDSIAVLNARIDSLQRAYDELLSAPFEPIEFADTTDMADALFESDEEHNLDSLLAMWYLQRDLANDSVDLIDVENMVLASDIPDSVYIERLNQMNSFIKVPYNNIVRNYIVLYTQRMPGKVNNIIGLSKYYLPIFEEIFLEYDLPQELKAMAMIESAFNAKAISRAKAAGMWQFMYNTARKYNLRMDSYVDERFDPYTSCRAAAEYLRDSYLIFGDWSLAIASYNCGAGNVNKAIRRSGGGKDFWDIYQYLPKETRGYVPAFVAALYTLQYYPDHGIVPTTFPKPAHIDTFTVTRNLHFGQISENIGIDIELLRDLNPQYKHDIIPATEAGYTLRLPFNYSGAFVDMEEQIYGYKDSLFFDSVIIKDPKSSSSRSSASSGSSGVITYKVKSGDNLGSIAKKYGVTVANIKSWNNLKSNTIRVGQNLKIYGKGSAPKASTTTTAAKSNSSSGSSAKNASTDKSSSTSGGYIMYTVRKGDTLWEISNKYEGVTLQQIMTLNGFTRKTKIYPGMKIKIKKQ